MTQEGRTEETKALRTQASILMQPAQVAEDLANTRDRISDLEEKKAVLLQALGEDVGGTVETQTVTNSGVQVPSTPESNVVEKAPVTRTMSPSGEKAMRLAILEFMDHGGKVKVSTLVSYVQTLPDFSGSRSPSRVSFLLSKMVRYGDILRVEAGVYRLRGFDRRVLGEYSSNLLKWIKSTKGPVSRTDIIEWIRANHTSGRSTPSQLAANACVTLVRRGDIRRIGRGKYTANSPAA